MKYLLTIACALACAMTMLLPASLQAADAEDVVFSALEKQIIGDYYRARGEDADRDAGKGKGKNKGLPPGIAKNLERGKPLPPGIQKTRLPNDLQQKLPAAPEGHERVVVDGKVLLVDIATGIIRDKIEEAID